MPYKELERLTAWKRYVVREYMYKGRIIVGKLFERVTRHYLPRGIPWVPRVPVGTKDWINSNWLLLLLVKTYDHIWCTFSRTNPIKSHYVTRRLISKPEITAWLPLLNWTMGTIKRWNSLYKFDLGTNFHKQLIVCSIPLPN